jgi:putative flippase GtrA
MMRLVCFAVVGVIGAGVHIGGFWLIQRLFGLGNTAAWIMAFMAAATSSWALNRRFTFQDRASVQRSSEWMRYLAIAGLGAIAHFATFHAVIAWFATIAQHPALAIIPGSISSLCVTYLGASLLVFRKASSRP